MEDQFQQAINRLTHTQSADHERLVRLEERHEERHKYTAQHLDRLEVVIKDHVKQAQESNLNLLNEVRLTENRLVAKMDTLKESVAGARVDIGEARGAKKMLEYVIQYGVPALGGGGVALAAMQMIGGGG